ncbi:alpha-L-arabinofuranosidase C-terminal domain-containing protein [Anaeromicropila populeti]|uniref:non-reducing end alpha-L-arabinofuranosidase n=1 Tax=Anaeromicropila populeti TaxID=37658 RepID=A0A1I6LP46_9FIRM|nr:alpha-L-arabinofuranosidase C-terminal domain-containing protein [Anaeromicropila populeti]SFS05277.1 Alpha-L-arabinofuranosidase [Anaeromicropila populeti]
MKNAGKVLFFLILVLVSVLSGCNNEKNKNQNSEMEDKSVNQYQIEINGLGRGIDVSDTLYGLFFEDINFAADGGLYAEMVKNRSFEFQEQYAENGALHGYEAVGDVELEIMNEGGLNKNNSQYIKINNNTDSKGGITNKGFLEGMFFQKNAKYDFSVYIKRKDYFGLLTIELLDEANQVVADGKIDLSQKTESADWEKYTLSITAKQDTEKGRLSLLLNSSGTIDIDMVSLFPQNTYKNRKNGLRADLVAMLEELNPSFIRFPGGCIVEGNPLSTAYKWKDTIGDISERKQNLNLWIGTKENPYYQTYGLGFYEYFQLCEDLGAKPVPVVNCGMSCQARANGQTGTLTTDEELEEYIQDALDLIEFCRGDGTTEWGAKRIEMGHEQPFDMEYLGIGNEQWGEEYFKRYTQFVKAIREKYPDIQLITTSGPASDGDLYEYAWNCINSHNNDEMKFANLVDEHYYNEPEWFLQHVFRYDTYERENTDVFLGEYAAKSNTLKAAVAEAAYMTGLERNSDVVKLAAYAPLFGNTLSSQWKPDMIWFNQSSVFGSANYYVQKMFMNNVGDYIVPSVLAGENMGGISGYIGLGTWKTSAAYDDIKVVNNDTGQVLYETDFLKKDSQWKTSSQGNWGIVEEDGESFFVQKNDAYPTNEDIMGSAVYIGTPEWKNYTFTVRAKKISGSEGFLIPFAVKDLNNFYHWNIGGWNNTRSVVEQALGGTKTTVSEIKNITIRTGEWYEIKVVVKEERIECYLNDELYHSIEVKKVLPVYETVSMDEETNDIIIKLVNSSETESNINLKINQVELTGKATVELLTGSSAKDENTWKHPELVKTELFEIDVNNEFIYKAPAYSVSVIRMRIRQS